MTRAAVALACWGVASIGAAQTLPADPMTLAGGRVVISGDAAAGMAPADDGFFNYSDYEHSTLREIRLGVTAAVRATNQISLLGEVRSENFGRADPFALYARVRPFVNRRFDIQIGRIPPTFGSFPRAAYTRDNPLIGYPLAYQYLISLRPDSVPANVDELLRMRGRGWLSSFSIGNRTPQRGVPLVTAFNWDTGVQVSAGWHKVNVAAAVTNGSVSNPRVSDDNPGKQIAARVSVSPMAGFMIGSSFARGQFLNRRVLQSINDAHPGRFVQRAFGADAEYSRDHWLTRVDAVLSEWQMPLDSERLTHGRLRALAASVEGRYTFLPGAYAAARAERLTFNRVAGSTRETTWEAPVSRLEVGGGYYFQRNLIGRVSVQFNHRDGGRVTSNRLTAAQLVFWF